MSVTRENQSKHTTQHGENREKRELNRREQQVKIKNVFHTSGLALLCLYHMCTNAQKTTTTLMGFNSRPSKTFPFASCFSLWSWWKFPRDPPSGSASMRIIKEKKRKEKKKKIGKTLICCAAFASSPSGGLLRSFCCLDTIYLRFAGWRLYTPKLSALQLASC